MLTAHERLEQIFWKCCDDADNAEDVETKMICNQNAQILAAHIINDTDEEASDLLIAIEDTFPELLPS